MAGLVFGESPVDMRQRNYGKRFMAVIIVPSLVNPDPPAVSADTGPKTERLGGL